MRLSISREGYMQLSSNQHIYDLEQPRYFGAPIHPSHAPGYFYTLHRHHERGAAEARTSASGFMYTTEHSGTHIDGPCCKEQADLLKLAKKKMRTTYGRAVPVQMEAL
jgi:kynurenine formamidase